MAEVNLLNISKWYNDYKAVENLTLQIKHGEFMTLLGPSGCGKTSTLRMIAGLESISTGELLIDGKKMNDIAVQDRGVGLVFQSYALFPHMTVEENIAFGLRIKKIARTEIFEKMLWVTELLGLQGLEKRYPRELSGGQRQRVAVGRALVLQPRVLLLDEPLSNLDADLRNRMSIELKRIHQTVDQTIVYVTHNQLEALSMSDRITVMKDGKMVQVGTPHEIYNNPKNIFVAGFVGSPKMNFFSARIVKHNGIPSILSEDGITISMIRERYALLDQYLDHEIIVGIRPSHIFFDERKTKRYSDSRVKVIVDVIEPVGDRNYVVCKVKNTFLTFLANPDFEIRQGDQIEVIADGRKVHLFFKENDEALF